MCGVRHARKCYLRTDGHAIDMRVNYATSNVIVERPIHLSSSKGRAEFLASTVILQVHSYYAANVLRCVAALHPTTQKLPCYCIAVSSES